MKQATKMQEAAKRYLVALVFTGLNSGRHKNLNVDVNNDWVRNNVDSFPRTYECLTEITDSYNTRDRSCCGPMSAGVALLNASGRGRRDQVREARGDCAGRRGDCWRHDDQEEKNKNEEEQQGELYNVNNKGQSGCWNGDSKKH